jgi:4a-hydroxytetrahydrobiopterin dehydratase
MSDPQQTLTPDQVDQAALDGWELDGDQIGVRYATGDFATGLRLVNAIGALAEEANHHPDVMLIYPEVGVTLSSHDVGGVTSRDLDLARRIGEAAAEAGIEVAE